MLNRFTHISRYAVTAALVTCLCWSAASADEPISFEIPAQPAAKGLNQYAEQANLQIMFPYAAVKDVETNEVVGEFDKDVALETLLADTGLEVVYGKNDTATVRPINVPNEAGGSRDSGNSQPTPVLMAQNQTSAQQNQPIPSNSNSNDEDADQVELENIIVTGTRIRGAQSASPLVTITRQDIDQAGFATVEELVTALPQNFAGGISQAQIANPTNQEVVGGDLSSFASGGTSVNLRGLGASSTLVLLNGRRLSASGRGARYTDISGIPVTAIERVEVLTDGASAIYGSDAIGGVVNFILRDSYEGAETRLRYGSDSGGDTSEVLFGQTFGTSWDAGNILLSYEYYKHDSLANIDRDFAASSDLRRFGGDDWRSQGGNPANIFSFADFQIYAIPSGQNGTGLTAADFPVDPVTGAPSAPPNVFSPVATSDMLPESERHSAFLSLSQDVGAAKLFANAQFSTTDSETRSTFGTESFLVTAANPFFVDPTDTGQPFVFVLNYLFLDDLGPSTNTAENDSYGAVLGATFDIGEDWSGEFAANWTREEATGTNANGVDPVALAAALGQTDPNLAFNPFGDGSNSNPAVLAALRLPTRDLQTTENEFRIVNLDLGGSVFNVPGGAAKLAAGLEYREESLQASIDLGGPTLVSDIDDSRDVVSAYAELFVPAVSTENSRPGLRRLEFSLAARYEDYSDFGDTVNPKVGFLWSPTEALTIRGTWGTSFRAPALIDSNLDSPLNSFIYSPVVPGLTDIAALTMQGANENLKAEEATTWTAGFQWTPESVNGLSLDVTYFNVDFEDRIDTPFLSTITGRTDPRFASLLNLTPTSEEIAAIANDPRYVETVFGVTTTVADILSGVAPVDAILDRRKTNLSQSVVTGVELQLSYDFETTLGSFGITLNGNYLADFERALVAADPLVDEVDTYGRPVDLRARGSVTWSNKGWSVAGFVNYVDGYTDNVSDPERSVDSWTTVDLTIAYETGDNRGFLSDTSFSLTTQNVFDEDPPFLNNPFGIGYDVTQANGLGRFLALQITKEW